jgi:hypothetical protein
MKLPILVQAAQVAEKRTRRHIEWFGMPWKLVYE